MGNANNGRPQTRTAAAADLTTDILIIGGGFFGCEVAVMAREHADKVMLVEANDSLLSRASYNNQARIHNGYHYPRSILTALRSRVNFARFCQDFSACVVADFDQYYAVARQHSKVTAKQFETFCHRIDAPLEPAPPAVLRMFDTSRVEAVWRTREYAFDSCKLADQMCASLAANSVDVHLATLAKSIEPDADGFSVELENADGSARRIRTRWLFNCTYSALNFVLTSAGRAPLLLKHEIAELALCTVPEPLRHIGITVMCGPFFSLMPFPPRGLHSFSHVRYTPHAAWHERDSLPYKTERPVQVNDFEVKSSFPKMQRDAARYLPLLTEMQQVDSLWELKTVLPQSEGNDSRPILFHGDPDFPRLVSVMGGKIDNIYDIPREIANLFAPHGRD